MDLDEIRAWWKLALFIIFGFLGTREGLHIYRKMKATKASVSHLPRAEQKRIVLEAGNAMSIGKHPKFMFVFSLLFLIALIPLFWLAVSAVIDGGIRHINFYAIIASCVIMFPVLIYTLRTTWGMLRKKK